MISHKHNFIFIHIPKCAGSSIKDFYFDKPKLDWKVPNYELLYGWCPKRKIHLQHATSQQLLELDLIKPEVWEDYFKFTFTRNPYDRAVSDYFWLQKDRNIKGKFKDYITKSGVFKSVLRDNSIKEYRGDHLQQQTDFFEFSGQYNLNYIGRFEHLESNIQKINNQLRLSKSFNIHSKKNLNRKRHYSFFYTKSEQKLVDTHFDNDIKVLGYKFEDKRTVFSKLKKWI